MSNLPKYNECSKLDILEDYEGMIRNFDDVTSQKDIKMWLNHFEHYGYYCKIVNDSCGQKVIKCVSFSPSHDLLCANGGIMLKCYLKE